MAAARPVALLPISRIRAATVRFRCVRYGYAGLTGAGMAFGEAVDALTQPGGLFTCYPVDGGAHPGRHRGHSQPHGRTAQP